MRRIALPDLALLWPRWPIERDKFLPDEGGGLRRGRRRSAAKIGIEFVRNDRAYCDGNAGGRCDPRILCRCLRAQIEPEKRGSKNRGNSQDRERPNYIPHS